MDLFTLEDKKIIENCPLLKSECVYEKLNELITRLNAIDD